MCSRKNVWLIGLLALLSNFLWAKDPIGWTLNQSISNQVYVFSGPYSAIYTFKNQLPFTLVNPLHITKHSSSSEFSYIDLCTGKKLQPNETCTVEVLLKPISPGLKTVNLIIECYDKNQVPLPPLTSTAIGNPGTLHTVGGEIYGLIGGDLVLVNNNSDPLTKNVDGSFTFSQALPSGSNYEVTIQSKPNSLECFPFNNRGTITNADVTNVDIFCSTVTYSIGGNLTGLPADEFVELQNNGTDTLFLNADGLFTFSARIPQSANYNVTVLTHPPGKFCSVDNGQGTNIMADVTDVQVICSDKVYSVGGQISGLAPLETVDLTNNGVTLTKTNGGYTFFPVANGASYNVEVSNQPATKKCTVANPSGTVQNANVTGVNVTCVNNSTTLIVSPDILALSVNSHPQYSTGLPRSFTVTNTGPNVADNLIYQSGNIPSGTTFSTCPGDTIAANGGTCTITITPGAIPTSNGSTPCNNGTQVFESAIQIFSPNSNKAIKQFVVLDYGCIYQGGYVYSFDDSPASTLSVKGKVASTNNQAPLSMVWSPGSGIPIYAISELSTIIPPLANPNTIQVPGQQVLSDGATNGFLNTGNIYAYYQSILTPLTSYAAGLCKLPINSFSDWYLPAVCELGFGSTECGSILLPTIQNMESNLVIFNNLNLLTGLNWSSTQSTLDNQLIAWRYNFIPSPGGSGTGNASKLQPYGVRCSRIF